MNVNFGIIRVGRRNIRDKKARYEKSAGVLFTDLEEFLTV